MPRQAKPWFRADKGTWYARLNGKRISLGVQGKHKRREALQAWAKALADAQAEKAKPKPTATVQSIVNAYLDDAESRVKAITVFQLRHFLTPFVEKHGHLKAEDLTPTVAEAYSRKPTWAPATRITFLGRLVTAFRWAKRARIIASNPLEGVHKPKATSRGESTLLTPEQHQTLLGNASPAFALFLKVLWACGCRPGEASAITAENFDADAGQVRLQDHKTARKTGKCRVLYLPPEAVALLKEQRAKHETGHLLRTSIGTPWTNNTIGMAMLRLRRRTGVQAIAYGYRHTFATDALANGVPDAQVAELLGHQGTGMLHKHYSHLFTKTAALRSALANVRG